MTLFIGDVHGKYRRYREIIRDHMGSIQVGDMGIGFINPITEQRMANPPHDSMLEGQHRFIRGNHDSPEACKRHSQWIKDGTIQGDVMFVGGATSIDKAYRIRNYTWWEDEELSLQDLNLMIDVYRNQRPRVMVTHDCPEFIAEKVMAAHNQVKFAEISSTRVAFQAMLEAHQPDIWVFGHWHVSFDKLMNGTRFVCLAELEYKEIEVGL